MFSMIFIVTFFVQRGVFFSQQSHDFYLSCVLCTLVKIMSVVLLGVHTHTGQAENNA